MKDIILKAENISKQYRLGQVGTGTLSHDLNRWWHRIRGKENPYLKIGETNDRTVKGNSDYVWALQDINFEVERGEVLGIIGKNGAGKSTLLKILSKVTAPTTGSVKSRGRIASLLEVGTGFNGEMTGRENIFLNGAILGMTKKEINSKLDEIIEFSGCERYIDTPVKRYSSGMTVRLAFAVAAFLEPEILVVDEVLAVGDADFQKKAIGKMQDVSKQGGRTVLFVSHNMAAVQKLCTKCILLRNGKFIAQGRTQDIIQQYLEESENSNAEYYFDTTASQSKIVYSKSLKIEDLDGNLMNEIPVGKPWRIRLNFIVNEKITNLIVAIGITDIHETAISSSWSLPQTLDVGNYEAFFLEETIKFNPGRYKILIGVSRGQESIEYIDAEMFLVISDVISEQGESVVNNKGGLISNQMKIYVEKN
ncbi:lipopolysaccharide transport system ATP-binding protein [Flavobacterium nitrogenifigens]|uniref:Lipopolysaccharide transport system ATP-binding protein n=2 Tax=Flavobacterium TaxID=237 RepID=A0A7W7IZV5_9FLAO|nr:MULTISPECIES: ABC transporter ATP-binding protein [Flavobacterium]MBB4803661.1 lipopolysaccharide transport system ATP-binding protein [Flavobacterium nitrogenifigens]MBB6388534.1 lipopolysaccharide transport system ATP-binding protein [Flavobacterium notoginsengisoli]